MTPEERACWIADGGKGRRLARDGKRWQYLHDRALRAIRETLEHAAEIALAIDSGRGNEKEIAQAIRALKDEGLSIILVEQNAPFAIKTVDRVSVITKGQVVYDSPPQERWENEEIKKTHLGIG